MAVYCLVLKTVVVHSRSCCIGLGCQHQSLYHPAYLFQLSWASVFDNQLNKG